jgi:hypothetical protein
MGGLRRLRMVAGSMNSERFAGSGLIAGLSPMVSLPPDLTGKLQRFLAPKLDV